MKHVSVVVGKVTSTQHVQQSITYWSVLLFVCHDMIYFCQYVADATSTHCFVFEVHFVDLFLQAAPEDELRLALGLQNYTSGKGKVELKDSSMRPIEIFMCSVVSIAVAIALLWDADDTQANDQHQHWFCAWSHQLNLSCICRSAGWVMVKASAGFLSTSSNMLCSFCRSGLIATAAVTGC